MVSISVFENFIFSDLLRKLFGEIDQSGKASISPGHVKIFFNQNEKSLVDTMIKNLEKHVHVEVIQWGCIRKSKKVINMCKWKCIHIVPLDDILLEEFRKYIIETNLYKLEKIGTYVYIYCKENYTVEKEVEDVYMDRVILDLS